jgi:hypothetical protein
MLGDQRQATVHLHPGKKHGTHCTVGWMDPTSGLDGCQKLPPPLPPAKCKVAPIHRLLLTDRSYKKDED